MTADYDDIKALNWSTLKHVATSALMLKWRREHSRPDSPALSLGHAIHCAVLEPERWGRYVVEPKIDKRYKEGKAVYADWLAGLPPDAERLSADEYATAERCAAAVRAHPRAADLLRGGRVEEPLTWTDPETGIACKGRLDLITPSYVLDLKSTRHGTIRQITNDCARYLYHGQLAWYHDGAIAAGRLPADASAPRVLIVQTTEPYDVVPARLSALTLEHGRELYRALLRRYIECDAADWYPGLAPELVELTLPNWGVEGVDLYGADDGGVF